MKKIIIFTIILLSAISNFSSIAGVRNLNGIGINYEVITIGTHTGVYTDTNLFSIYSGNHNLGFTVGIDSLVPFGSVHAGNFWLGGDN